MEDFLSIITGCLFVYFRLIVQIESIKKCYHSQMIENCPYYCFISIFLFKQERALIFTNNYLQVESLRELTCPSRNVRLGSTGRSSASMKNEFDGLMMINNCHYPLSFIYMTTSCEWTSSTYNQGVAQWTWNLSAIRVFRITTETKAAVFRYTYLKFNRLLYRSDM